MPSCSGYESSSKLPSSTSRPPRAAQSARGIAIEIHWLGTVPYAEALELQHSRAESRRGGECADALLLLEHPPVITQGRSARPENLLISPAEAKRRGIDLYQVNRGGDVTYHAPGQLVGYPILDLEAHQLCDVGAYLRRLEAVLIDTLESCGVPSRRIEGKTGVFVDAARSQRPSDAPGFDRKLASIGVGLRSWVTFHGFALNVDLDLAGFDSIVPCGLERVEMSSVAKETGAADPAPMARVRERLEADFLQHF